MAESKIYVPKSGAKQITESLLKLSFKVDDLIPFLQQHKNEKGYVNFGVSPRKEVGQYGDTHSVWLDTWKPGDKKGVASAHAPTSKPATVEAMDESDVPF